MTIRPIIFNGEMVRALLDGRKTQTRQVLKPQPEYRGGYGCMHDPEEWGWEDECGNHAPVTSHRPRGQNYAPGDLLWVRETWAKSGFGWGNESRLGRKHYRADPDHGWQPCWGPWKPSIHMPRWASRLTLRVTDVRVQRVQKISEGDAEAEGCSASGWSPSPADPDNVTGAESLSARDAFTRLWNSIYAKRGTGWDANPWVVAITFDVIRANVDSLKEAA